MEQSKKISEGALLAGIYAVLMIISIFIPMVLMVAIFLLPVPFIMYASKYNWKPSLIMLGVALLVSTFIIPAISIPLTILVGLGGIMIGTAIHLNLTAYETWARGTIGFIAGLLFIFLFSQFILQINLATEMESLMNESLQMSTGIMEQFGFKAQTEEELALIETGLAQMMDLIPVGIAITAIILAFFSQWASYRIINRLEGKHLRFPPFRNLQLPMAVVWIYFIAIILSLFGQDLNSALIVVVNNVLTLTGLFMVLQGFSFIFFYAHAKHNSNMLPVVCIIFTILFPFLLLYFVRILGIIDLGFGLRNRFSSRKK